MAKKNTIRVSEIFHSMQGEGTTIGLNTVFLRLSGCNLACSYCDTKYHTEGIDMTYEEILKEINSYNSDSITITGGEPLLHQDKIVELLKDVDKLICVETNGTIVPSEEMKLLVDHWSVSIKLVSSGNELQKRINYDSIEALRDLGAVFKFVVDNESDLDELQAIQYRLSIPNSAIYLMKQGQTRKEQYDGIEKFVETCKHLGYNFSPRVHIMIYDNTRRV